MAIDTLSLFSGCGGLDLGAEKAGFNVVAMNENDPAAVDTLRANFARAVMIEESVENLDKILLGREEIDCLIGGPPCQAFSVFGKRRGIQDKRGRLIFEFSRVVEEFQPKVFLMENVRGLLSTPLLSARYLSEFEISSESPSLERGSLIRELVRSFNEIGYHVDLFVVNSANYGSPQIRERVFLIGNRFLLRAEFPKPTHSNRPEDDLLPFRTLGDAIGQGFKDPDTDCMNFSERKLKYLAMVPPGHNWRSLPEDVQKESMKKSWHLKGGRSAYWRKLSFDFPSPTVVTMPNHAGTSMCHPTELRAITVGEAAAIQEFPSSFKFMGTTAEKMRQVGNAVPVGLAEIACTELRKLWDRLDKGEEGCLREPGYTETHLRPHVRTRSFFRKGQVMKGNASYQDRLRNDDSHQTELSLFVDALE